MNTTMNSWFDFGVGKGGNIITLASYLYASDSLPYLLDKLEKQALHVRPTDFSFIQQGGGDHNPLWMGEEPSPRLHNINQERDAAELMITRLAFNRQIPMLGICRGIHCGIHGRSH